MKVIIIKASSYDFKEVREMNSNEILNLLNEFGSDIVISKDITIEENEGADLQVTIYDDYIE